MFGIQANRRGRSPDTRQSPVGSDGRGEKASVRVPARYSRLWESPQSAGDEVGGECVCVRD